MADDARRSSSAADEPPSRRSRPSRCREDEGSAGPCGPSPASAAAGYFTATCIASTSPRVVMMLATVMLAVAMMAPKPATAFTVERPSAPTRSRARGGDLFREFPTKFDGRPPFLPRLLPTTPSAATNDNIEYDEDEEGLPPPTIEGFDFDEDDAISQLTRDELNSMTVAQLKQQLRLRGKKVSGSKAELVERLLEKKTVSNGLTKNEEGEVELRNGYTKYEKPISSKHASTSKGKMLNESEQKDTKRVVEAKARGADIVDVSDFIDAEEVGKSFRSSDRERRVDGNRDCAIGVDAISDDSAEEKSETETSSPEVWGEDARIVDDYEGRSVVVDGLSRTVVEFTGSNGTAVQAYVVGSRDSLKNFLRGGDAAKRQQQQPNDGEKSKKAPVYSSMEEEVYAIQKKRERESKRGLIRPDEVEGAEDASDPGAAYDTVERDYGDWGVFTPTGAQLSSSEVQGVLLLSDVYGAFTANTQALADKIAFECQPAVVMVPDLFRGRPWTANATVDDDGVERNEDGKSYEEWRATHPERRVDVDIRAAAAVLRRRYAVCSIAVWGTCYGGGRALEAAAGWYPGGPESYYEDTLGGGGAIHDRPAPPHVDPIAAVAWYPTRYDVRKLFGKSHEGFRTFENGADRKVAVMAVFAGEDTLPGSTPEDAALLKESLEEDARIKDCMVKVFPGQGHGFAHANLVAIGGEGESDDALNRFSGEDFGSVYEPLVGGGGDAEVACLLSTAWMETYSRVFLPTAGTPVRFDVDERWSALEMDITGKRKPQKELRAELDEAIFSHEDVDVDLRRMAQSRSPLSEVEGPGAAAYDAVEDERERIRREVLERYDIREDDDEESFDRKFERAREDGALDGLLLDAYMDDAGEAYW